MDAWDADAFGNDSANDWLAEVVETSDLDMIHEAFDAVLGAEDESVDLQTGEEAIAGAELVAWLAGHNGPKGDHVDLIESWIDENELEFTDALAKKAKKAVDRVFNAPSELREAWEEDAGFEDWKKQLASLKERLG